MKPYDVNYVMTKTEKIILSAIILNSGLSQKELCVTLSKSASALSNKLKLLKKHNFVLPLSIGKNVFYYPNYKFVNDNPSFLEDIKEEQNIEFDEKTKEKIELYNNIYKMTKTEKEILSAIIENPGLSNIELANYLHKSPDVLSNKIKILKEHNLVLFYKIGNKIHYYANDNLIKYDEMKNIDKVTDENDFPLNRKEEENYKNLIILLLYQILKISTSKHAKIILSDFEFFNFCFDMNEFTQLLFLLEICSSKDKEMINSLIGLDFFNKSYNFNKNLLLRYQDICYYLGNRYEECKESLKYIYPTNNN